MVLPFKANSIKKVIAAQVFSADRSSSIYENTNSESTSVSLHINWGINATGGTLLGGTIDGTITLYVSNDGVNFVAKANMAYTLATDGAAATSGSDIKNLHGLLKERFLKVVAAHANVTSGTIEVYLSLNK